MDDLGNVLFYKVKFSIAPMSDAQGIDPVDKIIIHMKDCLTQKWNRIGATLLPKSDLVWSVLKRGKALNSYDEKSVHITSEVCTATQPFAGTCWTCKIVEQILPENGTCPRRWITELGCVPLLDGGIIFSCTIFYCGCYGPLSDCFPIPFTSTPSLIKNLLQDKELCCTNGCDVVRMAAKEIRPKEWTSFQRRLENKERTLPYIYISPKINTAAGEKTLLIDPEKLAAAVGGNAAVYYATNAAVTDEMNRKCSCALGCSDGAIRIYYPGLDSSNAADSCRHDLLTRQFIEGCGEEIIFRTICRAIAQNVSNDSKLFGSKECVAMGRELQNESKSRSSLMPASATSIENSDYRMAIRKYPETVQDVVHYFETVFGDFIGFSDDAIISLENCKIKPSELWRVLFELATTMRDLYQEGKMDVFEKFSQKTGIATKRSVCIAPYTDRKQMLQCEEIYYTGAITLTPNSTASRVKQSIHFIYSAVEKKVIVDWCGVYKRRFPKRKAG